MTTARLSCNQGKATTNNTKYTNKDKINIPTIIFSPFVFFVVNSFVLSEDTLPHRAVQILNQHCLRCHNADTTRGGLDLSTRKSTLQGGATNDVLVPQVPTQSPLLLRAMAGTMPPERDGRQLNVNEIAILRDWIQTGANWPEKEICNLAPSLLRWETTLISQNACASIHPSRSEAIKFIKRRRLLCR